MDSIRIDTGEKRIAIERDGDKVGELVFSPDDVVFVEKFYDAVRQIKSYDMPDIEEKDEQAIADALARAREFHTFAREKIDYAFGAGTSAMVFGNGCSFNAVASFLDGVTPFIRDVRAEKVQQYLPPTNGKKARARKSKK